MHLLSLLVLPIFLTFIPFFRAGFSLSLTYDFQFWFCCPVECTLMVISIFKLVYQYAVLDFLVERPLLSPFNYSSYSSGDGDSGRIQIQSQTEAKVNKSKYYVYIHHVTLFIITSFESIECEIQSIMNTKKERFMHGA